MKTTHTPGPWFVRYHDMVFACNRLIADCEKLDKAKRPAPPIDEDIANARLISASPNLLDALESLLEHTKNNQQIMGLNEKARAAIAKARG